MDGPDRKTLPPYGTRQDYFAFLDGYAVDTLDNLKERHRARTLVKSYVLETLDADVRTVQRSSLFPSDRYAMEEIEDGILFRLKRLEDRQTIGLIEFVTPRHPVLYTLIDVNESDRLVSTLVREDPDLDQVWLPSSVFEGYWSLIRASNSARRFTKIGFEYMAAFDREDEADDVFVGLDEFDFDDADADLIDRRTSKFTLQDRLSAVARVLEFKKSYAPFNSIVQIRVPSATAGGHDIYYNGKATNRSRSFIEHRQQVMFLAERYQRLTETVESRLWASQPSETTAFGQSVLGVPFEIRYHEPLPESTFDSLIASLRRKNNKLRLSGFYNQRGRLKVHLNGVDRHLWQPVWLEITNKRIIGILPTLSCGNIVNRMVANIQRLVDPDVTVWIGNSAYGDIALECFSG